MAEPKDEHDHNGMYPRRAECLLVRQGFERELEHMQEDVREVKAAFNKILWILITGFAVNLGGSVLLRVVVG